MSTREKPDPARGWQFVEKLLANDDLARLDDTTDEEVDSQMRAQGVREPSRVPSAEELLAKAAARAADRSPPPDQARGSTRRTLRVRPKRTQWVTWLAAAAIGMLIVTAWITRSGTAIVDHPFPVDGGVAQNAPTPRELAGKLREDAFAACHAERWTECEGWLDEAKRLDPDGERDRGVRETRQFLSDATRGAPD